MPSRAKQRAIAPGAAATRTRDKGGDVALEGPAEVRLYRSLRLVDVALFFVVAGSNLQWIATAAAAGPGSLCVWLIGAAAMFVPLALVVVFLSSRYPDEGGMYLWSKRAFGPFAGFMTGWLYWMSNLPYFPALLYFTASNALYIAGIDGATSDASPLYFIAVSLAGLALATWLNIRGLDAAKWLNNAGGVSRWLATLALVVAGVLAWWKFGSATPLTPQSVRPGLRFTDILFWSTIAFAWTGPEAASFMSGEIRDARRSIPIGLALAMPLIAFIYIAGTASVLVAVPSQNVSSMYGMMQAVASVAQRFHAPAAAQVVALLVTVSCLGSVGAWLGAVARIPFVAGVDRYLPAVFARMHPRWNSPVAALLTQAFATAILIVLGQSGTTVKGAYNVLVSATVIITLLPFLFVFAAALRLRDDATAARGIAIPGGAGTIAVAAGVGLFTTLASIVLAIFPAADEPNKALAVVKVVGLTIVVVVGGALAYRRGARASA